MIAPGLIFGIYPFGVAGTDTGVAVGPPDDYEEIGKACTALQGSAASLVPRTYVLYTGSDSTTGILAQVEQYVSSGLKWDIVLCFRDAGMELDGWLALIRTIVRRYGLDLEALHVTAEANLALPAGQGDGNQPNVRQALVQGVIAAKGEAHASNAGMSIGFDAVPAFDPRDVFWDSLKTLGGQAFANALDYVGLNFYPDVFGGRIAPEHLRMAVETVLRSFRTVDLPAAGIPASVPIRITENGWPTGPDRSYERQADVLETVIRTIYDLREDLHITHYELFGLRDANSSNDNLFYQFGIVRDDYTPKPAFYTYQKLIEELSAR